MILNIYKATITTLPFFFRYFFAEGKIIIKMVRYDWCVSTPVLKNRLETLFLSKILFTSRERRLEEIDSQLT